MEEYKTVNQLIREANETEEPAFGMEADGTGLIAAHYVRDIPFNYDPDSCEENLRRLNLNECLGIKPERTCCLFKGLAPARSPYANIMYEGNKLVFTIFANESDKRALDEDNVEKVVNCVLGDFVKQD
jgi:hypothetical protein